MVAVAVLKECCMASADMQWLFYLGERIMARGPLVFYVFLTFRAVGTFKGDNFVKIILLPSEKSVYE